MAPPPKNKIEIAARNRLASYRAGWLAGAAGRAADPAFKEHLDDGIREAYRRGMEDGIDAYNAAYQREADACGIDLRTAVLR